MHRNLSQIDRWNNFCSISSSECLTVAYKNFILLVNVCRIT